ncbi:hypothetical protein GIB67_039170 [Kingdonia uniflora]|uniref:Aminotransferase-like plant mobile domain-containing protein n=1 Tax=Kingdonia uniflora TaxID=39325 RepID=A0A7J7MLQ2_9MAGN|nr:hypothetical protein GIB67_039170 [Kingdonia uniflora]
MYTINEKVPPTASNRRKREFAKEDLFTYKRKRKTIDPSTIVPPNIIDTANEGVSGPVPPTESAQAVLGAQAESAQAVNISQGSEFETESAQTTLGAQPPLPNVSPDSDVHIPIVRGYSENGGVGNSLSLRKLKEYYAYKLEKVLSDSTAAAAKKKKGLRARFAVRAYMLYVLRSFLFPMKKGSDVSARYLYLFAKDKVAKKWLWGLAVLAHMYYNLGTTSRDNGRQFACCTMLLELWILAHFPKLAESPRRWTLTHTSTVLIGNRTYLLRIDTVLVLQSHQPVPDATLEKKYDDLLAAHGDVKKKLIAKEDFRKKLVNAVEQTKSLEVNNSEWHNKLVNSEERKKTLEVDSSEWVCSYGHQQVEYRHMAHLLSTYYEKVVVFISRTEAYTFLPLFWAHKKNTTSNEERLQNLLMDSSKYLWYGLGVDNQYVRLFPRFNALIPPVSTIFYSHVNLEIPLSFLKEQLTRYFDVRVRNFKALLREHNVKGYRVNDMVVVGLSTIK